MKEDITYECKLSSNLTQGEKDSFISVFNRVFNLDYNMDWFNWKYMDNIYGDSYLVLAYDGNKLVGIRSFWRNDINGHLSYQPCDTAVLKEYRGRGIFSKMSLIALEKIKDAFIYNFPNENSLPGNLKLGWKVNKYCYLKPVLSRTKLKQESKYIDDDYLIWKFGESPINKYHYYEKDGQSYLLYGRKKNIYYVLGRFNDKYSKYFTKVNYPILFNYTTKRTIIYKMFKNRTTIVSFERENQDTSKIDIPIFKGDFF
ncbi:MAG: GNAT family N-acetyltransferase [Tissierellia bacterium]|nr:GNAT family N-acetyltransferase [Tissierellia bacterium]